MESLHFNNFFNIPTVAECIMQPKRLSNYIISLFESKLLAHCSKTVRDIIFWSSQEYPFRIESCIENLNTFHGLHYNRTIEPDIEIDGEGLSTYIYKKLNYTLKLRSPDFENNNFRFEFFDGYCADINLKINSVNELGIVDLSYTIHLSQNNQDSIKLDFDYYYNAHENSFLPNRVAVIANSYDFDSKTKNSFEAIIIENSINHINHSILQMGNLGYTNETKALFRLQYMPAYGSWIVLIEDNKNDIEFFDEANQVNFSFGTIRKEMTENTIRFHINLDKNSGNIIEFPQAITLEHVLNQILKVGSKLQI